MQEVYGGVLSEATSVKKGGKEGRAGERLNGDAGVTESQGAMRLGYLLSCPKLRQGEGGGLCPFVDI